MMQMLFDTVSHKGTRTATHKHKDRHTIHSLFSGCTHSGLCPRHISVLSCQDASPLDAENSFSVIGADRDCTGKLGLRFVCVGKCVSVCTHAELNEIHPISGSTLKMNICHILKPACVDGKVPKETRPAGEDFST